MYVANRAVYHPPSSVDEKAVITAVVEKSLFDPVWNDVFETKKTRKLL